MECENITASSLTAAVSGSGDLELKGGKVEVATYSVTGAGDLNARKLQSTQVTAKVSGSGDIMCNATTSLNASISGAGEIKYVGNPQIVCSTTRKPSSIGL